MTFEKDLQSSSSYECLLRDPLYLVPQLPFLTLSESAKDRKHSPLDDSNEDMFLEWALARNLNGLMTMNSRESGVATQSMLGFLLRLL